MPVRSRQHIATLDGEGSIYRNDELLGTARYRLLIYQQMLDAGGYEVPGLKEVVAFLSNTKTARLLVHQEGLVLHLEEGGRMPFIVSEVGTSGHDYEIKPSNEITGVPELE